MAVNRGYPTRMPDEEKNEQSLRFGLLSSRLGLALYFLLPNRWCWACLSQEERSRIDAGNEHHNNYRPDYADPNQYQQGLGFDSAESSRRHRDRHRLVNFLDRLQPRSVLEIGPGSGHLTRVVVEHPAVHRYTAVDINNNFLTHLRPRLASLQKPRFTFNLVHGNIGDVPDKGFDAAVLMSSLHHIPDREALFHALAQRLTNHGSIIAIAPTHYILRFRHVIRKITSPGYLAKALEEAQNRRLSTHAMCQLAEYQAVTQRTGFEISQVTFDGIPSKVRRLRDVGIPLGPLWRWMSQEMTIECSKRR